MLCHNQSYPPQARLDKEQWLLLIRQSRVRFIDFRSYFTGVKEIVNTRGSKKMHLIAIN